MIIYSNKIVENNFLEKKIKFSDIFINVVLVLFVFQAILQEYIKVIQYFDEIMTIFSAFLIFYFLLRDRKVDNKIFYFLILIVMYSVYGLFCNFFTKIATPAAIFTDVLNQFKLYICFIGFYIYFRYFLKKESFNLGFSLFIFKVIILLGIIFYPIMWITRNPLFIYEYRLGIPSYNFIFGHPGTFNTTCLFFLSFLTFDFSKRKKYNSIFYITLCLFLMVSTLRSRAFITVAIYLIFVLIFNLKKSPFKSLLFLVSIPIALYVLGYDSFETYFINSTGARAVLMKYGLALLREKVPFGYGFGTYGSYAAAKYYSPLYDSFGFGDVYGLSKETGFFLTDNYWPMIFGQFGVIGVVLTTFLISKMYFLIVSEVKHLDKKVKIPIYSIGSFVLVNSIASSSFVHYTAVAQIFSVLLIIYMGKNHKGDQYA